MKALTGIVIGASALLGLVLAGGFYYKGSQPASPQPTPLVQTDPLLPYMEWPLGHGQKVVELGEAQALVPYSIPLPESYSVKEVWVLNDTRPKIAIQFDSDLLLKIHQAKKPPHWDRLIAIVPKFKAVSVNGNSGMGTDPGATTFRGIDHPYHGFVEWRVDGLDITLYSDTMPLDALLKVAETVR